MSQTHATQKLDQELGFTPVTDALFDQLMTPPDPVVDISVINKHFLFEALVKHAKKLDQCHPVSRPRTTKDMVEGFKEPCYGSYTGMVAKNGYDADETEYLLRRNYCVTFGGMRINGDNADIAGYEAVNGEGSARAAIAEAKHRTLEAITG